MEIQNVYRTQGAEAYWRRHLATFRSLNEPEYQLIENFARLGDRDNAFRVMDLTFQARDHRMTQLKVNPILDPLRSDPRFDGFLRRMNRLQ